MTYEKKYWQLNDTVLPGDMNRIEQGVLDNTKDINDIKNHKIKATDVKTNNSNVQSELDTIKAPGWIVGAIGDGTISESKLENVLKEKINPIFTGIANSAGCIEHNGILIQWGRITQVINPGDNRITVSVTQLYEIRPSIVVTPIGLMASTGVGGDWINAGDTQEFIIMVRNPITTQIWTQTVNWLTIGKKRG